MSVISLRGLVLEPSGYWTETYGPSFVGLAVQCTIGRATVNQLRKLISAFHHFWEPGRSFWEGTSIFCHTRLLR